MTVINNTLGQLQECGINEFAWRCIPVTYKSPRRVIPAYLVSVATYDMAAKAFPYNDEKQFSISQRLWWGAEKACNLTF